ncbi:DUF2058 family protein [Ignatzschineria cameli]|uniref:DUF2058 domain-containing protein n=1 Tax=Ignatzschineria cameli TaxID=2182793 RepID=A0A2U2AS70_9GAMM|nr:DUF2058 family protein [Ignatzschineria cameli]PWD86544.1 DUF2058 domain-containing protein [Ignatzschineria cameli]PWD87103.1 DUF2058 domain-containing protein [Ignatzschineria cameli]PWD92076.1 DUF2058 domain-containing protein [Ignatzschineria cameli]PWD93339.1 DUF2058 domain-containing protein [Ignatzschineria cameli]PWD94081.1 DUF2058 domain-containing protein [Ignatzschineria cameli]
MSLRDQLVKAGLVSKDRAQKAQKEKARKQHQAHRDKQLKSELEAEKQRKAAERRAFDEAKKAMDLERNQEIIAAQEKNRARSEMRDLIDRERVNKEKGETRFNFSHDGKKIRSVFVTDKQHKDLSDGKLMICRNDRDGFDYPVLPVTFKDRIHHLEEKLGEKIFYYLSEAMTEGDAEDEWAAWDAYEASLKAEKKRDQN